MLQCCVGCVVRQTRVCPKGRAKGDGKETNDKKRLTCKLLCNFDDYAVQLSILITMRFDVTCARLTRKTNERLTSTNATVAWNMTNYQQKTRALTSESFVECSRDVHANTGNEKKFQKKIVNNTVVHFHRKSLITRYKMTHGCR